MATLSVGGTTIFDGATLQSGAVLTSATFPAGTIVKCEQVSTTPTSSQGDDASYTDLTGSSKSYTPATGASYVVYEYTTTVGGNGVDDPSIQQLRFMYDGSMVDKTEWHIRLDGAISSATGYVTWKFILPVWSGAKTMSVQYQSWSSSYDTYYHMALYSGAGKTTTDVFTKVYQTTYSVM